MMSRSPRQSILKGSLKQSTLSSFFASQRNLTSPEERVQATLADVADSACRTLHQTSQKHMPCAIQLLEGLPRADRQETLTWMAQAFDVMNFPQTLFFDTALLLDRYYARLPKEDLSTAESQRRILAAVCVAIKTGSNAETQLPLRQVVTHLGHDEVPFDEVIAAELCILRKLRFDVGTPTPREFLEALGARLKELQVAPENMSLADYFAKSTPRKRLATRTNTAKQESRKMHSENKSEMAKGLEQTDSIEIVAVKPTESAQEESSIFGPHVQILLAVLVFLGFTAFLVYYLMEEVPHHEITNGKTLMKK